MTKFDIRLRRSRFTQTRIESHKNYQSLMERHYESSKKKTRGVMVLVILLILTIAILVAVFNNPKAPKQESPKENMSFDISHYQSETMEIEAFYKV